MKIYVNGNEVASFDDSRTIGEIVSAIKTVSTLTIDDVTSNEVSYHDEGNVFKVVVPV